MVNAPSSQPKPGLFDLPELFVARHPSVVLAPRALKDWLQSLPLANPPKSAAMLLQQLRLMVRDPQPGARLAALLDLYEPTAQQLLQIARERMHNNPDDALPLDQLEFQVLEIVSELAYGYLRSANDQLGAGKPPTLPSLYRAMIWLDEGLDIAYLHYQRPPTGFWPLMIAIFLTADAAGLARQEVGPDLRLPGAPATLHGLFFRALVIGLCDPHHHRPAEILAWRDWIGNHTASLELAILPQGSATIPVDMSGSRSPLAAARMGKPGPSMRYVAADGLLEQIKQDSDAPPALHVTLTELIKGRRSPEQRQTARHPRNQPYTLLHGLRNIHQRLLMLAQGPGSHDTAPPSNPCRQINQSKLGAAFQLQATLNPPLAVGEPVLAETEPSMPGAAPAGFTASIQRLFIDTDGVQEIGVEKLQGRIMPVTLSGQAAQRAQGDIQALLQHRMDNNTFTLIATRSIYREGDHIAVEGPSVRHNLRMGELFGTSRRIAYIAVEVAPD